MPLPAPPARAAAHVASSRLTRRSLGAHHLARQLDQKKLSLKDLQQKDSKAMRDGKRGQVGLEDKSVAMVDLCKKTQFPTRGRVLARATEISTPRHVADTGTSTIGVLLHGYGILIHCGYAGKNCGDNALHNTCAIETFVRLRQVRPSNSTHVGARR